MKYLSRICLVILSVLLFHGCVSQYKPPSNHLSAHTSKLRFNLLTESFNGGAFISIVKPNGDEAVAAKLTNGNWMMGSDSTQEIIVESGKPLTFKVEAVASVYERIPKDTFTFVPQPGATYTFDISYDMGALKKRDDTPDPGSITITPRSPILPASAGDK